MEINIKEKILIIGLGLIGGSYARVLTEKGFEVGALDISANSIEYALRKNIIAHGKIKPEKEYIEKFDIIIFALYPQIFIKFIEEHQHKFKSGAFLTDVTGVKGSIVYKVQEKLRKDVEFIPAHPMAGREVYGVENSCGKIFEGANFIVTPTQSNTRESIEKCKELGNILGFGTISELSPEKHDEMIGFLSQLPHCIAVALMNSKESVNMAKYSGDSFRDFTRIANINENMWSELFLMNKEKLLEQIELFTDKMNELKMAIENADTTTLKNMMKISSERRKYFDNKKGDK